MKIVLARVDERLVHGQVIASWSRQLGISRILLVDDGLAEDSFMNEVLSMSAPAGVAIEVLSCENGYKRLQEDDSGQNTMLLFKSVQGAYDLVKAGYPLKELDIGNIGSGPGRRAINKRLFMSPKEIELTKELCGMGVHVYSQMLSTDPKVDIEKIL